MGPTKPGVETTNQFHAAGKTACGINMSKAKKQILLNLRSQSAADNINRDQANMKRNFKI
jgi:hypothetical protein